MKPLGQMTKTEMHREAADAGLGSLYVANAIWTFHPHPFARLAGLVALLRAGRRVFAVPFGDILMIDGRPAEWATLERAADAIA